MLDKPLISCVFFSCGLSSLPLDIVFPREPVFNSVKFSLSRVSFTNHVFGAIWKNASPYSRSSRSSPMLSCRSFAVLHSTLRSTIDFNFGEGIRCASRSLFGSGLLGSSACRCLLFQRHWHCLCFTASPLLLCQRWAECVYAVLFQTFAFFSTICPVSHQDTLPWLAYLSDQVLKSGNASPSTLFFSFNIVSNILDILPFILDWPYLDNPRWSPTVKIQNLKICKVLF